ncbi:MAG: hypothetical protein ACREFU_20120 [Acetobacteraceae bacterium]
MPRGGRRPGSGRPPGAKNCRTREIAERAAESGVTPIEYVLAVMLDETVEADRRDRMAVAAAPYIHPRLAPSPLGGTDEHEPTTIRIIGGLPPVA